MKKIFFFCLFCIALSCKKEKTNITPVIITCIGNKIEAFKKTAFCEAFINEYSYKGKIYYYFDNGTACDGTGEVLDEQCVQYCVTCGDCIITNLDKECGGSKIDFFNKAILIKQIWKKP